MLSNRLQHIIGPSLEEAASTLGNQATAIAEHQRFLGNRTKDDPHLRLFHEFVYRHLSSDAVVDLDSKGASGLKRLAKSFYMGEDAQFVNLTRLLWLEQSLSRSPRSSNLYRLNKISGLDQKKLSLEELAQVRNFGVATYECPGQIETLAELSIGFTALMALATQTFPIVMLYGDEGSARNRHLTPFGKRDRQDMYVARKDLLEAFNFSVTEIDIPQGFFSMPDNFAIPRAMRKLEYFGSFEIDDTFIRYIIKREFNAPQSKRTKLFDIVKNYGSRELTQEEYEKLAADLRKPLIEIGLEALHKEEIYDIADVVLKADSYKNPEIATNDPDRKSKEARAVIWRHLLPSKLTEEIMAGLLSINPHFGELEYDAKKQSVEYFMGEVIHIVRPLLEDPHRAFLKVGNETERHWDEFVYDVLGNPQIAADAFWLFGDFFGARNGKNITTPKHSPFGSLLYQHFTILEQATEEERIVPRRAKYISYGIPANRVHVEAIPLISDIQEDLLAKFSSMAQYNPDDISRLVIGVIYSLLNIGDGTNTALERFRKNREVLFKATVELPEAYQRAVSVLDPRSLPQIIDARIKAGYEAKDEVSEQLDTAYVDNVVGKVRRFEELVRQRRESTRGNAIQHISTSIQALAPNLEQAITLAESYLGGRYKTRYDGEVADIDVGEGQNEIPNIKLGLLANEFFKFYRVPRDRRDKKGTADMESFLERIGIANIYDINVDENLRQTQEDTPTLIEQLNELRDSSRAFNDRYMAIAQGMKTKGEKLPGIDLGEYLEAAAQVIMHLSYRKKSLEKVLGSIESEKDITQVVKPSSSIVGDLDYIINKTLSHLLTGVDRIDLINFLQKRFDYISEKTEQENVVQRDRNPERARKSLESGGVGLKYEIDFLRVIDQRLREFEEQYISDIRRFQYPSTVMFPHELQQFSAFRNAIHTWIDYYKQAMLYIEGRRQDIPPRPAITLQSQSAFAISPEQASNFFSHVLAHLRKELGDAYLANQRARVQAVLN